MGRKAHVIVWTLLVFASFALAEDSAWSMLKKGRSYLKSGDYKRAQACFESAARRDPRCSDAHYYLGRIQEKRKDRKAAKKEYLAVKEDAPTYSLAQDRLGYVHLATGDKKEAAKHFEASAKARPTPSAWMTLAGVQIDLKEYKKAEESLNKAAELTKGDFHLAELQARLYIETDREEKALDVYRSICERFPNDSTPRFMAGVCLLQLGRKAEAADAWVAVLEKDPYHRSSLERLVALWKDESSRRAQVEEYNKRLEALRKNPPKVVARKK
jgi:tetratricopeptide (TPR) repeat protein